MKPKLVNLTPEQLDKLEEEIKGTGKNVSVMIREIIDLYFQKKKPK
jgi:predicted DNA-binding protein